MRIGLARLIRGALTHAKMLLLASVALGMGGAGTFLSEGRLNSDLGQLIQDPMGAFTDEAPNRLTQKLDALLSNPRPAIAGRPKSSVCTDSAP